MNCNTCEGKGESCRDKGSSKNCSVGICGRINFMLYGTRRVHELCIPEKFCIGTINCNQEGFEYSGLRPGASDCVNTCCQGENCNPKPALKCYRCKGKGETCSSSSVSCGYGEDRCIRINFKVNGVGMVDERCYQYSRCGNESEICGLVNTDHPTASDCETRCCEGDHCNDETSKASFLVVPLVHIMAAMLLLFSCH